MRKPPPGNHSSFEDYHYALIQIKPTASTKIRDLRSAPRRSISVHNPIPTGTTTAQKERLTLCRVSLSNDYEKFLQGRQQYPVYHMYDSILYRYIGGHYTVGLAACVCHSDFISRSDDRQIFATQGWNSLTSFL